MKNKIKFLVNNGGTLELLQEKDDADVKVMFSSGEEMTITNGDFVMLINLYNYVKRQDIQNDFINYNGKNKEVI